MTRAATTEAAATERALFRARWFRAWWWFSVTGSSIMALNKGSPHTNPVLWIATLAFLSAHGWLLVAGLAFVRRPAADRYMVQALVLAGIMAVAYLVIFH